MSWWKTTEEKKHNKRKIKASVYHSKWSNTFVILIWFSAIIIRYIEKQRQANNLNSRRTHTHTLDSMPLLKWMSKHIVQRAETEVWVWVSQILLQNTPAEDEDARQTLKIPKIHTIHQKCLSGLVDYIPLVNLLFVGLIVVIRSYFLSFFRGI